MAKKQLIFFPVTTTATQLGHCTPQLAAAIKRGRKFLIAEIQPYGSWPETTRPSGGESYAQRLSTTGWALLATR